MDPRVVLLVVGLAMRSAAHWGADEDSVHPWVESMAWRSQPEYRMPVALRLFAGCPPGYHEYNGVCVVALLRASFSGDKCPTGTVRVRDECVECVDCEEDTF
ncbi:jg17215 [Pararge aegeria aegeria]|uniref:Jg17215 protein n=1 Tax=Pararge aegeria aegeria TaxID=348720 RepID=A0A8S4SER6_9NEOP|nr:jg17215 [Pararge aegeria aegeria]